MNAGSTNPAERGRVLFVGQAYYNTWYLSRELRKIGWRADVLNWDPDPGNDLFYHGEDIRLTYGSRTDSLRHLWVYLRSLRNYDIFHFSNAHGMRFGQPLRDLVARFGEEGSEIRFLKRLGKKIVYTNNGCLDGVSQSSFATWGNTPVCVDCPWREVPMVCSDERNLSWGEFRNSVADYQILLGGNRIDFNLDDRIHEVPEFFCLDPEIWRPDLEIPERFRLPRHEGLIRIFHAVGNRDSRTDPSTGTNIKSSHIWLPLIEELRSEGYDVELFSPENVPNKDLRFYQAQSDIFVDMLTYGWFGATAREGMMLGKPVICYLRPEWLESMRREIPDYVDQLPVISATPSTAKEALVGLIESSIARRKAGERSRRFAVDWHSSPRGAQRLDQIYSGLIGI